MLRLGRFGRVRKGLLLKIYFNLDLFIGSYWGSLKPLFKGFCIKHKENFKVWGLVIGESASIINTDMNCLFLISQIPNHSS